MLWKLYLIVIATELYFLKIRFLLLGLMVALIS